ncbi:MAG: hypothetical protein OET90_07785, partial [Desulfuromonadales bacterium]|nr:hypothetical protein [Desulfuromonadales bacterium]
ARIRKEIDTVGIKAKKIYSDNKFNTLRNKYSSIIRNSFYYEFSQGDLDKVQKILNDLRDFISKSKLIEDGHKDRLLNRLGKLQNELHKRISTLDSLWGIIGDAGVVAGKLGKDSKPFVDRVRELSQIVWVTQARAEELPSNTPPSLQVGDLLEENELVDDD